MLPGALGRGGGIGVGLTERWRGRREHPNAQSLSYPRWRGRRPLAEVASLFLCPTDEKPSHTRRPVCAPRHVTSTSRERNPQAVDSCARKSFEVRHPRHGERTAVLGTPAVALTRPGSTSLTTLNGAGGSRAHRGRGGLGAGRVQLPCIRAAGQTGRGKGTPRATAPLAGGCFFRITCARRLPLLCNLQVRTPSLRIRVQIRWSGRFNAPYGTRY